MIYFFRMAKQHKKSASPLPVEEAHLETELSQLRKTVEELHKDLHHLRPGITWKKVFEGFWVGSARALGFIFGTAILATLIIAILQQVVQTDDFDRWIEERLSGAVSEILSE